MTPPSAAAAAPAVHPRRTAPPRRAPLTPSRKPRRLSGLEPSTAHSRAAVNPASHGVARSLLDRMIHGRAWIAIVAFALIGIVTMQLGLLKLNAGIGRALEHEAALQRENAALSVEDSEVASGNTIELQAAHMGMEIAPPGALRFLSVHPQGLSAELGRAVAALSASASAQSAASASSEASSTEASSTEASPSEASSSESATQAPPTSSESTAATSAAGTGSTAETATSTSTSTSATAPAAAPPVGEAGGASSPQG